MIRRWPESVMAIGIGHVMQNVVLVTTNDAIESGFELEDAVCSMGERRYLRGAAHAPVT